MAVVKTVNPEFISDFNEIVSLLLEGKTQPNFVKGARSTSGFQERG